MVGFPVSMKQPGNPLAEDLLALKFALLYRKIQLQMVPVLLVPKVIQHHSALRDDLTGWNSVASHKNTACLLSSQEMLLQGAAVKCNLQQP